MIEKYTRNTRFCLICNYVIKIIPALQSRCTRFRFPPLAPEHMRARLEHVVKEEGCAAAPARAALRGRCAAPGAPAPCAPPPALAWAHSSAHAPSPSLRPPPPPPPASVTMGPGGLDALVTLGCGDMRRSLNILQSAHMAFGAVDGDAVYLTTGSPMPRDVEAVVHWLLNEEFNEAFARELCLGGGGWGRGGRRGRGARWAWGRGGGGRGGRGGSCGGVGR